MRRSDHRPFRPLLCRFGRTAGKTGAKEDRSADRRSGHRAHRVTACKAARFSHGRVCEGHCSRSLGVGRSRGGGFQPPNGIVVTASCRRTAAGHLDDSPSARCRSHVQEQITCRRSRPRADPPQPKRARSHRLRRAQDLRRWQQSVALAGQGTGALGESALYRTLCANADTRTTRCWIPITEDATPLPRRRGRRISGKLRLPLELGDPFGEFLPNGDTEPAVVEHTLRDHQVGEPGIGVALGRDECDRPAGAKSFTNTPCRTTWSPGRSRGPSISMTSSRTKSMCMPSSRGL